MVRWGSKIAGVFLTGSGLHLLGTELSDMFSEEEFTRYDVVTPILGATFTGLGASYLFRDKELDSRLTKGLISAMLLGSAYVGDSSLDSFESPREQDQVGHLVTAFYAAGAGYAAAALLPDGKK